MLYLISRETNEIFLVECPGGKRTRKVLEPIIVKHVMEGSHIITDGWAAYQHLEERGNFCIVCLFNCSFVCLFYIFQFLNLSKSMKVIPMPLCNSFSFVSQAIQITLCVRYSFILEASVSVTVCDQYI